MEVATGLSHKSKHEYIGGSVKKQNYYIVLALWQDANRFHTGFALDGKVGILFKSYESARNSKRRLEREPEHADKTLFIVRLQLED